MMRLLFEAFADNTHASSLVTRFRRRRFTLFRTLLATLPRPVHVLDVGGRQLFWELIGYADEPGICVVLLNTEPVAITRPNFSWVPGDGRDMRMFADNQFDVVFSNSVIEHLGAFAEQQRMAAEIRRVGRRCFVQTPNRSFPIEPYFLLPYFQYLPISLRVALVRRFNLGWYRKIANPVAARDFVIAHRLLDEAELRELFPDASIYRERVCGLVKSFVAYQGWNLSSVSAQ